MPMSVALRPIASPSSGAYPRSTRHTPKGARPACQRLYYHAVVCWERKRRPGCRRLVVLPELVFFPGDDFALERPPNHRALPPNTARFSDTQPPASRFIHSSARSRPATRAEESYATVTPLAEPAAAIEMLSSTRRVGCSICGSRAMRRSRR